MLIRVALRTPTRPTSTNPRRTLAPSHLWCYPLNSTVKYSWRVDESWVAMERSPAVEREFDRSFDDEIAIDFPAVSDKVARMRHAFVASDVAIDWLRAEIHLSRRQAGTGAAVPIELPVRSTCRGCGGRGEVWGDGCESCAGSGHAFHSQTLTVSVPPGVSDGARFTFSVSTPRGFRTRVEVRVAVT